MIKDYFAPKTVEETLALLSQYKDESKVIAGGESLLILMRQEAVAPKYLTDIKGITIKSVLFCFITFQPLTIACLINICCFSFTLTWRTTIVPG